MAVVFINPSLDPWITVYCPTCMCAESCPKECFYNFSSRLYFIDETGFEENNAAISKYVTVTLDTDEERINVQLPCIQTYSQ